MDLSCETRKVATYHSDSFPFPVGSADHVHRAVCVAEHEAQDVHLIGGYDDKGLVHPGGCSACNVNHEAFDVREGDYLTALRFRAADKYL